MLEGLTDLLPSFHDDHEPEDNGGPVAGHREWRAHGHGEEEQGVPELHEGHLQGTDRVGPAGVHADEAAEAYAPVRIAPEPGEEPIPEAHEFWLCCGRILQRRVLVREDVAVDPDGIRIVDYIVDYIL